MATLNLTLLKKKKSATLFRFRTWKKSKRSWDRGALDTVRSRGQFDESKGEGRGKKKGGASSKLIGRSMFAGRMAGVEWRMIHIRTGQERERSSLSFYAMGKGKGTLGSLLGQLPLRGRASRCASISSLSPEESRRSLHSV